MEYWSGIDWQILYIPVILALLCGWIIFFFKFKGFITRLLLAGGAISWVIAQTLEAAQWGFWNAADAKSVNYEILVLFEESVEMIGSALFLLAIFKLRGSE